MIEQTTADQQIERLASTLAFNATGRVLEELHELYTRTEEPTFAPSRFTALAAVMIAIAPDLTLSRAEAIRASVHATEQDARTAALSQALALISRGMDLQTLGNIEGEEVARAYADDAADIIRDYPHLLSPPERERLNLI